jgi:vacuolar-type H+-ATPase subunit I/STV1
MEKTQTLSDSRKIVKQILKGVYTETNELRKIDLIFGNVETQDKEFIRLVKEEISPIQTDEYGGKYRDRSDCIEIINKLAGPNLI